MSSFQIRMVGESVVESLLSIWPAGKLRNVPFQKRSQFFENSPDSESGSASRSAFTVVQANSFLEEERKMVSIS